MDGEERTGGYDQHIRVSYCTDRIERIDFTFFSLMFKHVESFFKMGRGDVRENLSPKNNDKQIKYNMFYRQKFFKN